MPEFPEYPVLLSLDGSEVFVVLHGGLTKTVSATVIGDDLGAVTGPPGPTGAAGGGWFARYIFKTATGDADPGAGNLRLGSATQNASTVVRIDTFGSDSVDNTTLLGLLDDSTSVASKGYLRIFHDEDATKFIIFSVTSVASPSGYRNVTVTPVAWSAANPFVADDPLMLTFTPAGDKGETGIGLEGPQGQAGHPYIFDNPTADADPGNGRLRLNNATPSAATFIYIDDLTSAGADISAWLLTLDDSTSDIKGFVNLTNVGQTKSRIYKVEAAVTDAAGYVKIPVVHIGGSGTFTDEEPVYFAFDRNGDKGEDPIAMTSAEYAAITPDPNKYYYITDLPA